ncbi:MAG: hypothetical protein ACKVQA_25420 [Burkholderiales bacterium]
MSTEVGAGARQEDGVEIRGRQADMMYGGKTDAELIELEAKATPAPWRGDRYDGTVKYAIRNGKHHVFNVNCDPCEDAEYLTYGDEDTELTMAARNALPDLLAEIRTLRATLADAVAKSGEWRDAIISRAIIDGMDTSLPPREILEAILATARREALDPLVSEEAAKGAAQLQEQNGVLMRMYGELMQGLCNALAPGVEDQGVASELACETLAELPDNLERGKALAAEKDARIAELEAQLAAAGRVRAVRELRVWADSESVLDGDPPHEIAKFFVDRVAAVACLRAAVVGTLRNARKRAAEIEAEGRDNG